jgi:hypothetical protein
MPPLSPAWIEAEFQTWSWEALFASHDFLGQCLFELSVSGNALSYMLLTRVKLLL